jgi:uncharacterized protein with PhoU and TrkA domain
MLSMRIGLSREQMVHYQTICRPGALEIARDPAALLEVVASIQRATIALHDLARLVNRAMKCMHVCVSDLASQFMHAIRRRRAHDRQLRRENKVHLRHNANAKGHMLFVSRRVLRLPAPRVRSLLAIPEVPPGNLLNTMGMTSTR